MCVVMGIRELMVKHSKTCTNYRLYVERLQARIALMKLPLQKRFLTRRDASSGDDWSA